MLYLGFILFTGNYTRINYPIIPEVIIIISVPLPCSLFTEIGLHVIRRFPSAMDKPSRFAHRLDGPIDPVKPFKKPCPDPSPEFQCGVYYPNNRHHAFISDIYVILRSRVYILSRFLYIQKQLLQTIPIAGYQGWISVTDYFKALIFFLSRHP